METEQKKNMFILVAVLSTIGAIAGFLVFGYGMYDMISSSSDMSSTSGPSFSPFIAVGMGMLFVFGPVAGFCWWYIQVKIIGHVAGHVMGSRNPSPTKNVDAELAKLERLRKEGKITSDEYDQMRKKALGIDK